MIKKINKAQKKIILELADNRVSAVKLTAADKAKIKREMIKIVKPTAVRKPRKPRLVIAKTDWEQLAKRLQEALSKEIKETDALKEELRVAKHTINARDIQFYKLNGIVEYLEDKVNGNN